MIHHDVFETNDHSIDRPAYAYAADRDAGVIVDMHQHAHGQLVHAVQGSLKVTTQAGTWIVPSDRGVWIPGDTLHMVESITPSKLRFIYLDMGGFPVLPRECAVVTVSRLLRELILTFMAYPRLYDQEGPAGRLIPVIADCIGGLKAAPLHLPMPASGRLAAIATRIRETPSLDARTESFAREAAMSLRTFERKFAAETGLTFRAWRQQAKLLAALEALSTGRSVGDVAESLGYQGASAFIAMFRKSFGVTPGRYFHSVDSAQGTPPIGG